MNKNKNPGCMYYIFIFPFIIPVYLLKLLFSLSVNMFVWILVLSVIVVAVKTSLYALIPIGIILLIYHTIKKTRRKSIPDLSTIEYSQDATAEERKMIVGLNQNNTEQIIPESTQEIHDEALDSPKLIREEQDEKPVLNTSAKQELKKDIPRKAAQNNNRKPYTNESKIDPIAYGWMCERYARQKEREELYGTLETSSDSETINFSIDDISEKEDAPNIDSMDGTTFEKFCITLLQDSRFDYVTHTGRTGDQGIDIIACKDGVKYGIQCKCYSSSVGNKAVQEAFSGSKFYGCHVPIVLTNNYFTASARQLAEKLNVILWDRKQLEKFIEESKQ